MKLGIVGAGMIVHDFLSFAHKVSNLEIVAICATPPEEEKLIELTQKYNIPLHYTDIEEMLNNTEIDTIYLGIPNHLHFEFSEKAINAKKHVICEKPFTSNVQELEKLIPLAKEKNVILLEAVITLYLPNTLKIKESLPDLGEIKIVSANYSQYSSRYNAFKEGQILPAFDKNMSGGALMDLNIYNINFVVALFGTPQNIEYHANVEKGIDTSGILDLDYGTFKCVCIAAKDCKAPVTTTIQGNEGFIMIDTPVNNLISYQKQKNTDIEKQPKIDHNGGQHRMYHEFVEFVRVIDELDYEFTNKMLDVSLTTMQIQTTARLKAGVVFPADEQN